MYEKLTKITAVTALGLSLVGTPALAQEWTNWDADEDGVFSSEEFDSALDQSELFDQWDMDDDNLLSRDEYETGFGELRGKDNDVFTEYDVNEDETFDENEFGDSIFSSFDSDESGELDEEELSSFES